MIMSDDRNDRSLRVDGHAVDFSQLGFEHYRKLPVVIHAVQIDCPFEVDTLEGMHTGSPGDFLIKGAHGELYPCKPDIFAETYELVDKELNLSWYRAYDEKYFPMSTEG
ncbi:hypothetical protein LCGC14_0275620 [marine sediment metagenome]|uniref:Uncharacterized protein n=1 Tax=marine sediment metagenome TaxID=412755 RepID=A0A0F9UEG2_9ZZZZ